MYWRISYEMIPDKVLVILLQQSNFLENILLSLVSGEMNSLPSSRRSYKLGYSPQIVFQIVPVSESVSMHPGMAGLSYVRIPWDPVRTPGSIIPCKSFYKVMIIEHLDIIYKIIIILICYSSFVFIHSWNGNIFVNTGPRKSQCERHNNWGMVSFLVSSSLWFITHIFLYYYVFTKRHLILIILYMPKLSV